MIERRNNTRGKVIRDLNVYDKSNNNFIGKIKDIGLTGIKMECSSPLLPGIEYRLRIEIPSFPENANQFLIQADCIWWTKDIKSDTYCCGFEIVQMSENEQNMIKKIIDELCE